VLAYLVGRLKIMGFDSPMYFVTNGLAISSIGVEGQVRLEIWVFGAHFIWKKKKGVAWSWFRLNAPVHTFRLDALVHSSGCTWSPPHAIPVVALQSRRLEFLSRFGDTCVYVLVIVSKEAFFGSVEMTVPFCLCRLAVPDISLLCVSTTFEVFPHRFLHIQQGAEFIRQLRHGQQMSESARIPIPHSDR
jgi:hypothetical protein